ncbi:MAG: hypothetical protein Q8K42_04640, partial [Methylobacter sp.]|nr:hypothetical protein [Methylobacter sp.]
MKKTKLLLSLSLLFGLSSTALFAAPLTSNKDIIGSWFLEYTKKSPEDAETKLMGMTWVLDNSQVTQKDIPQVRGNPYNAPAVDYVVEDG